MQDEEMKYMPVKLGSLLEGIEVFGAQGLEVEVSGLQYDSRQVQPGFIFVCVRGFKTDGHLYIDKAVERGAVAVVIDRDIKLPVGVAWIKVPDGREALACLATNYYRHPSRELNLFGVTGTNGKTTTTHLIDRVLHTHYIHTGLLGTIANRMGDQNLPVIHTTPESLDLQSILRKMVDNGVKSVSMEVSSHALALNRVEGCEFDAAIFTNLTQDHLDFHQTMDNYLAAKTLLFSNLGRGRTKKRSCYGVINIDDPAGVEIKKKTQVPVITYGIRGHADVQACDVDLSSSGIFYQLAFRGHKYPFVLSLAGDFNVYNSLAAITVGIQEGVPMEILQETMKQVKGVAGRFEPVEEGQKFAVIVDYAHTPDGLDNVLRTAQVITAGRLITVFGCGGERDSGKRPQMGRTAGELSGFTIITSDNPRSEDPAKIASQIEEGIKTIGSADYVVILDRREAIRHALHQAERGDTVVIAGKGHETYQLIGDRQLPFDDHQVAGEIIKKEIIC
jgi:UDP-N-acetylmuramoyl-L-alanyl-D-glutamate--2,6-diaminopimelate ligase